MFDRCLPSFALALAVVATACTGASPTTGPGSGQTGAPVTQIERGNIDLRLTGDWRNPIDGGATISDLIGGQISNAMYDRLVSLDAKGKIIPYLASSWTQTATSVTFSLRKEATCSDGTPVTPRVVADSLKRLVSPELKSPFPVTIFGPAPYTIASDDGAGTVTFSVTKPYNQLLLGFTWYYTGIVCPAGLVAGADFEQHSYGSGPFVFQSAKHGEAYVVKRRPEWKWGPSGSTASDLGFPDTLTFKIVSNETTAANLLLTGGLDIGQIQGVDVARLEADKSLTLVKAQSWIAHPMMFNEDPAHATSDDKVREALMTAVDPSAWNKAANDGRGLVTSSIVVPDGLCYDAKTSDLVPQTPGDTAKARSILLAAGYTQGSDGKLQKNGKPLAITYVGFNGQKAGPDYFATQFNAMGATVQVVNSDFATFVDRWVKGDFDVVVPIFTSPVPNFGQLPSFLTGTFAPQGTNRSRIVDPELADMLAKAISVAPEQQCQHWSQVQQRVLTQHHLLSMAAPETYWFGRNTSFIGYTTTIDPSSVRRKS